MQIKVNNVSYSYDKKKQIKVLDNVSFCVEDNDFVAIIGKTGAGKSTLIQMLNGLIIPDEGSIQVGNYFIDSKTKINSLFKLRKDVGEVFQFPEYQLFEETILKDVMFGPLNFGIEKEEAEKTSIESLNAVGIDKSYFEKSPFEISGGEKRRVAIAGILASNPDTIILDEPTAGLDPLGKIEIMCLVEGLHKKGKTIIFVTHDMELVLKYATKVIVMNNGQVVKNTTPSMLFDNDDLLNYSLEVPMIYKFKNKLKSLGFKKDLSNVNDIDELVKIISEEKSNG